MDKTTKGFVIGAAIVVIGSGALYFKQVRAAAYDRCYSAVAQKVTVGFISIDLLMDGADPQFKKKFWNDVNACTNRQMFR